MRINYSGFTLIEILAVITIITIFLLIFIPNYRETVSLARQNVHAHNKAIINEQVERFYIDKGIWPNEDLSDIGQDDKYFPSGLPINPVNPDIPYSIDPNTHRVNTP